MTKMISFEGRTRVGVARPMVLAVLGGAVLALMLAVRPMGMSSHRANVLMVKTTPVNLAGTAPHP